MTFWNLGLQSNTLFEWNTPNLGGYKYGNALNSSLDLVGILQTGNWQFYPTIGMFADKVWADESDEAILTDSAGEFFGYSGGMEIIYQTVSLSTRYNQTIVQRHADMQLDRTNEILVSVKYYLNSN